MCVSCKAVMACAVTLCLCGPVHAGGIDRTPFSTELLFEPGRIVQFELGGFQPEVSGKLRSGTVFPPGLKSGDMSTGFGTWTLGVKLPLSEKTDLVLSVDHPFGANVAYPSSTDGYPLAGSVAKLESQALTGLLRYRLTPSISALAGIRIEQMTGDAALQLHMGPAVLTYDLAASREADPGYIIGVAWEKPEIAARVTLSYLSSITHDFSGRETTMGLQARSHWTTKTPQSILLEAQTGIAPDTLLFGSIRWTDWSSFSIGPDLYRQTPFSVEGSDLVDPVADTMTYTLGVGHRFNAMWSGAVIATYEPSSGDIVGNLGPTDGYRSLALAATWTDGALSATLGLRYIEIGGAKTRIAEFDDNSGWAVGLRLGYRF
ncbi:hypothetical protein [Thioclava sp. GXIMD4216]|uniref:hypothetical protein n=1 Tax=Thioclava sp. GXIMD4216 TaxID=3131929 RepID=UPI0030D4E8E3